MPEQAKPMWIARDKDCTSADLGCRDYSLHADEPTPTDDEWETDSGMGTYIGARQSPVELEPGGGPVKVRLVVERGA